MPYVPPHLRGGDDSAEAGRSLEALSLGAGRGGGRGAGGRGVGGSGRGGGGGKGSHGGGGKGGRGGGDRGADRSCALYADDLPPGRSLLGGAANFCDAFFHVRDTREAGLPLCCLRHPRECEGRHTVIIARLTDAAGATKLVARFKNRDKKTHAERVLIQDERLRAAVCDGGGCAGGTLSAFISLQPCHHSSGNESVSCTTDLIAYHARELAPRGVSLDLAIAYPYRSHWQPDLMSRDELIELGARSLWGHKFHSSVLADQAAVGKAVEALGDGAADEAVAKARALLANAREGARLLVRAPDGFVARGFRDADWRWLIGLCDDDVRANAEQILSEERRRTRAACDAWTQALLDGFRDVCLPCNAG